MIIFIRKKFLYGSTLCILIESEMSVMVRECHQSARSMTAEDGTMREHCSFLPRIISITMTHSL